MKLIDSKTYLNLAKSYAGECQAQTRYRFIEYGARYNGYKTLAELIDKVVYNEFNHARMFYTFIQQASDTMMSIEGLTDGFDEMCSGASQLAQQFAGYTNTLVQDGKPNQTMLTQYGKQFEKVLEMRETYREKRARVIEASQSYILRLRETFDGLKSAMDERKKTLLELFVNIT